MAGIVLAEGVVEVTADAKGVPRAIAKDIEDGEAVTREAGSKIGHQVFGGIIGAWAAIGGAQIIGGFFTGSITGASDLNETLSKSSQIFGANASAIESFGNNAAKNVGLSKEAAIAAAAGFGDMFTQLGFATDAAAAMSQQVVIASADLGSFNNLETADVADRISAAFRGEYDSLQAVIPNINAARVESEAMAATGKTVASELTAAEKATAVMAIVTADGARAMGDFSRTSDGAANQQKILTASMEDQQAKLGGLLLPAWTGFLGFLNDGVIPAFSSLVDWMSQNMDTVGLLAAVVGGAAVAYWAINSAMAIHKAFVIASTAATGGLTFAQWALNAAMTANPIGLIVAGIALLVAGIVWVATQTTFFQDAWAVMSEVIGTAWTWLWETVLSPVFTAIGEVFTWIYNTIIVPIIAGILIYVNIWAMIFTWLWETILSPIFAAIGAVFTWLYNSVIVPVVGFIIGVVQTLGAIFTWLHANVIAPVFAAVGAAFNWVWANVISPVVGFINSAIQTVGDAVNNVFGGIGSFIGDVFRNIVSVIKGPINEVIRFLNKAIDGANTVGSAFGVNISHIPLLAKGGRITGSGSVIVGERGPEILNLSPGASVVPLTANEKAQGAGGRGGDTNITVYESTDPLGSAGRVAAEMRKWKG